MSSYKAWWTARARSTKLSRSTGRTIPQRKRSLRCRAWRGTSPCATEAATRTSRWWRAEWSCSEGLYTVVSLAGPPIARGAKRAWGSIRAAVWGGDAEDGDAAGDAAEAEREARAREREGDFV